MNMGEATLLVTGDENVAITVHDQNNQGARHSSVTKAVSRGEWRTSLIFKGVKIAWNGNGNLTRHTIRGDYPSCELFGELFGSNPFFYGKTRFLGPAEKVDIKDFG